MLLKDNTQAYKQFVENESFRRFVSDKGFPNSDANAGRRFRRSAGNNFQETRWGGLMLIESTVPEIKTTRVYVFLPAICRRSFTACCLLVYDALPMGAPFRYGHLLPPDYENIPLPEGLHQRQSQVYITPSHFYRVAWVGGIATSCYYAVM